MGEIDDRIHEFTRESEGERVQDIPTVIDTKDLRLEADAADYRTARGTSKRFTEIDIICHCL